MEEHGTTGVEKELRKCKHIETQIADNNSYTPP